MWTHEYVAETTATPQQVWQVLTDLDNWGAWDTSLEWVRLQGPFAVGSQVVMKPIGQDPVTSTIVAATPQTCYADQTWYGGVVLRFSHTLDPTGGGRTRVTHRLEITGDGADQIASTLGPQITADFPDAMRALLTRATAPEWAGHSPGVGTSLAVLGSGEVGRALAAGFAAAGHHVVLGSRDTGGADLLAWAKGSGVSIAAPSDAVRDAEIILNATPGAAAVGAVEAAGGSGLADVVLLDVSNPLDFSGGTATVFTGVEDSIAERLQTAFPALRVVKSLCTVNNAVMVNPHLLPEATTMFIAGDEATAKQTVADLLRSVGWLEDQILDLGGIEAARQLEHNILLWLRIHNAVGGMPFNIRVVHGGCRAQPSLGPTHSSTGASAHDDRSSS